MNNFGELSRRISQLEVSFGERMDQLEAIVQQFNQLLQNPLALQSIAAEAAKIIQNNETAGTLALAQLALPSDLAVRLHRHREWPEAYQITVLRPQFFPAEDSIEVKGDLQTGDGIQKLSLGANIHLEVCRQLLELNAVTGDVYYLHLYQINNVETDVMGDPISEQKPSQKQPRPKTTATGRKKPASTTPRKPRTSKPVEKN